MVNTNIPSIAYEDDDFYIQFDKGLVWRKFNYIGKRKVEHWKKVGHYEGKGYLRLKYEGKKIKVHRFLMEKYLGRKLDKNEQVDHVNNI